MPWQGLCGSRGEGKVLHGDPLSALPSHVPASRHAKRRFDVKLTQTIPKMLLYQLFSLGPHSWKNKVKDFHLLFEVSTDKMSARWGPRFSCVGPWGLVGSGASFCGYFGIVIRVIMLERRLYGSEHMVVA